MFHAQSTNTVISGRKATTEYISLQKLTEPSRDRAEQVSVTTEVLPTVPLASVLLVFTGRLGRLLQAGVRGDGTVRGRMTAKSQMRGRPFSNSPCSTQYSTRRAARAGTTPVGENVTALES